MKKKIIAVIAALVCLVAVCVVAVSVSADPAPVTSIDAHNLALEDNIYIIYYVNFENVPSGAEKGVLIWTNPVDEYVYGTENEKLIKADGTYESLTKYNYTKVSAKMMSQDIYAKSFVKVGDTVTYSELDKYSVLQYAYNKKGSTTVIGDGTVTLGELLNQMLNYGAVAQQFFSYNTDRLANAEYYQINTVDGIIEDGTTEGLYKVGAEVNLIAEDAKNDIPFAYWIDENETVVGTEKNIQITVENSDKTYTAVYEIISTDPKITVENKSANAGDTGVKVAVSLKNNPGFLTMALNIEYDQSVMTLTKVALGSDFTDYTFTKPKNLSSGCKAAWYTTDLPEEIVDGDIMVLTFTIKNDAASGTYDITISDTNDGSNEFEIATATGKLTIN